MKKFSRILVSVFVLGLMFAGVTQAHADTMVKILGVQQHSPTEYSYSFDAFEGSTRFLLDQREVTAQSSFPSDADVQTMVMDDAMDYMNNTLVGHNLLPENIQFYVPKTDIDHIEGLQAELEARVPENMLAAWIASHFPPLTSTGMWEDLDNKPTFATVSLTGAYSDLTGKPSLFSGAWADITGKPTLFSGSYTDLTNKPTLFSGSYNDLTNRPSFAQVATSGDYAHLTNKPSLGRAYDGTTERTNTFPIFKSATVASGNAVFHLTHDGTSGGTALFPNGVILDSVQLRAEEGTTPHAFGTAALSNSNKTLTVPVTKLATVLGILSVNQPATGSVIKLSVTGY